MTEDRLAEIERRIEANWETREPVVLGGCPGFAVGPDGDCQEDCLELLTEVRRLRRLIANVAGEAGVEVEHDWPYGV